MGAGDSTAAAADRHRRVAARRAALPQVLRQHDRGPGSRAEPTTPIRTFNAGPCPRHRGTTWDCQPQRRHTYREASNATDEARRTSRENVPFAPLALPLGKCGLPHAQAKRRNLISPGHWFVAVELGAGCVQAAAAGRPALDPGRQKSCDRTRAGSGRAVGQLKTDSQSSRITSLSIQIMIFYSKTSELCRIF